jgi:hypothetical protein
MDFSTGRTEVKKVADGNYIPCIYYRLQSGHVLIITETEEWKKAVQEKKTLYINPLAENHSNDVNHPFPPEHVVELLVHSYIPAEQE